MHTCIVVDCNSKNKGLGYCSKHYQRYKKRGTIEGFKKRESHGLRHSPEYGIWCGIKKRCYNKNCRQYNDWGGRGIKVCDEWLNSFISFLEDMGPRPSPKHSIERINNSGNYEASNCKWATASEQASNRRTPSHYFRKVKTTTGFRGVYPYKTYWVAKIWYKKKLLHIGSYEDPIEAARAYDKIALKLYGDTSILNFPVGPL
jgi:AP2 domain